MIRLWWASTHRGLSPRIRGKPRSSRRARPKARSIPAHTGQTTGTGRHRTALWVYPRAYGANKAAISPLACCCGLSPRIRGKRSGWRRHTFSRRSIPAHTGQTTWPGCGPGGPRVYPRAYGANAGGSGDPGVGAGLSPRIRGKPAATALTCASVGSIPAHTGQTFSQGFPLFFGQVYPRAYGANHRGESHHDPAFGLSPRIRGKPLVALVFSSFGQVYPRAYGANNCLAL